MKSICSQSTLASLQRVASFYRNSTAAFSILLSSVAASNPRLVEKDGSLSQTFLDQERELHWHRQNMQTPPPSIFVLELALENDQPARIIEVPYDGTYRERLIEDATDHPEDLCYIPISNTERGISQIFEDLEGQRPDDEFDGLMGMSAGNRLFCESLIPRLNHDRN